MKKVLSIVLVLAMVLGSVAMVSAADYKDQAAITNKEAVAVLSELKVLEGDANGFRPTDTLTRAEAAAIIARLVLGREEADKLAAAATQFSDVPATHWAAGYINYCVSEGILAGNGDGTFNPEGLLTVSAFQKMVLCALGYDAAREGLVGSNWEAATASLAVKAGVTVNATGSCTRETAALLGLKALEADVVEYDQAAVTVNAGGAQVVVGGSSAKKITVANTAPNYKTPVANDQVQQLVEKVYKEDLIKTAATDDFGHESNQWKYKKKDVGTFAKDSKATVIYTASTSTATINNDLKNYTYAAVEQYVNSAATSAAIASAADLHDLTGNGRTVEVFTENKAVTKVIVVDKYVAKVTKVNKTTEENTYEIKDLDNTGVKTTKSSEYGYGAYEKDDLVLVTYSDSAAKIESVEPLTKVTGSISKTVTGTSKVVNPLGVSYATKLTVDGTEYSTAVAKVPAATAAGSATYEIYLDAEGLVQYTNAKTTSTDYVVATKAYQDTNSGLDAGNFYAQVVFMDGTISTVRVVQVAAITEGALAGSIYDGTGIQGIYSYTVSGSKYTLTPVNDGAPATDYGHKSAAPVTLKTSTAQIGSHYLSDSVNVIAVKNAGKNNASATSYTGKQEFAGTQTVYYVTKDKVNSVTGSEITDMIVLSDAVINEKDGVIYARNTTTGKVYAGTSQYDAKDLYIDGVKTNVPVKENYSYGFYKATVDADGVYTLTLNMGNKVTGAAVADAYGKYITIADAAINGAAATEVAEDAVIIDLRTLNDSANKIEAMSDIANYVKEGYALTVSAVYNSKTEKVTTIIIHAAAGGANYENGTAAY